MQQIMHNDGDTEVGSRSTEVMEQFDPTPMLGQAGGPFGGARDPLKKYRVPQNGGLTFA